MIGLIAGTGFYDVDFLGKANEEVVNTKYGEAHAVMGSGFMLISRHGKDHSIPPHMINHKANISAFKEKGVDEVIGITSVGSLRKSMVIGSIIVPHDFMQLAGVQTFFDSAIVHVTPSIDGGVRRKLLLAAANLNIKVVSKGVYFQAIGPRLETKSEINLMKDYADIVGMTMATEATLSNELGIRYAAISTVDNYANGVTKEVLDFKKIIESMKGKKNNVKKIIKKVVEETR
jgi:5'-methylthioadenosine phosphorylase